jgi:hypothetical protein
MLLGKDCTAFRSTKIPLSGDVCESSPESMARLAGLRDKTKRLEAPPYNEKEKQETVAGAFARAAGDGRS